MDTRKCLLAALLGTAVLAAKADALNDKEEHDDGMPAPLGEQATFQASNKGSYYGGGYSGGRRYHGGGGYGHGGGGWGYGGGYGGYGYAPVKAVAVAPSYHYPSYHYGPTPYYYSTPFPKFFF